MLAVFGGTFDPLHLGHLGAALAVRDRLGVEQVLLVPAATPPHRPPPVASPEVRLDLVREAIRGHDRLAVSSIEREREGPSFTLDTLNLLVRDRRSAVSGESPLLFVVGADAFREIHTWSRYRELLSRYPAVVHPRAGCTTDEAVAPLPPSLRGRVTGDPGAPLRPPLILLLEVKLPDISSRAIRDRLRQRLPIAGLVPDSVRARIAERELYR